MCGLLPQGVGSIGQRSDWSNVDICLARDLACPGHRLEVAYDFAQERVE